MEPWQLVVLLGALIVVGAMIAPRRKASASDAPEEMQRMQLALEQFMENMEEDNRELVEAVTSFRDKQREEGAARDERAAALESRCRELEGRLAQLESRFEERLQAARDGAAAAPAAPAALEAAPAAEAERAPSADAPERTSAIRERYGELFALHAQGKSIDVIARKTNMNKGEVMLILQLANQEEERRDE